MGKNITIYCNRTSALSAWFKDDGSLDITSEVYGEEHDDEKHYLFTKEQVDKLLAIIPFEKIVEECRKREFVYWLEDFLAENNIEHSEIGF